MATPELVGSEACGGDDGNRTDDPTDRQSGAVSEGKHQPGVAASRRDIPVQGGVTRSGSSVVGDDAKDCSTTCYLCGMQVTNINIHWRLNHRRVRIQPGAPKSLLGFPPGGSESPSLSVTSTLARKTKRRRSRAVLATPARKPKKLKVSPASVTVVCSEPDPLELYSDDTGGDLTTRRSARKFRMDALSPSAQSSAVQSLAFLEGLGGSNIYSLILAQR